MAKNILIDSFCGHSIGALTQDKRLLELQLEKNNKTQIVGSIFKGKVKNVLPGMQAAFIDIGLEKNGYLSVGETLVDKNYSNSETTLPSILDIKEGDEILVQATKDPIGTKGARLTTTISFAGKYLVYVPDFSSNSISKKIVNEEEKKLAEENISKIKKSSGGFIGRTSCVNADSKILLREGKKLIKVYKEVIKTYKKANVGDVIYSDGDLAMRMLRDTFSKDIDKVYVNDKEVYKRILSLPSQYDDYKKKLSLFTEKVDMLNYFDLLDDVDALLDNTVNLSNGAYLIIDRTEALTVIDVNTGSFVGEDKLEETVFETNVLSAKEIAKQIRLRNIGGIIVVDFIDMNSQEHRDTLVKVLESELKNDPIKCNIIGMTGLGLVEFTRQKKRKEISNYLTKSCPYCQGNGHILSNEYILMKIRASLLDIFYKDYSSAIIDLNIEICDYILKTGILKKDIEKYYKGKRIYLIPHKTYHQEFYLIKGENSEILDVPEKAKLLY